jgi:hypothetical protein
MEPSLDAVSSPANPSLDHVSGRTSVDECAPQAKVIPQDQAAVVDVYDDAILGDLDERFDPSKCWMATNEDVLAYISRVVVLTDQVKHILHHGKLDYYLIDNLKNCIHSFKNGTKLSDPQTNSRCWMSYPQTVCEFFTNAVSFVRQGGELYDKHMKELRISFPMLAKFVLQHGLVDAKRDGDQDVAPRKRWINVGCCGQVPGMDMVNGLRALASTFGTEVFDKDPVIKQMMANIMDAMTDLEDEIVMGRLGKTRSFYHSPHLDRFGIPLRVRMGAVRSRHELYTIQLKCVSGHERALAHKDGENCPWVGYTNTGALCGFFFDYRHC